jgi:hypothetical protein
MHSSKEELLDKIETTLKSLPQCETDHRTIFDVEGSTIILAGYCIRESDEAIMVIQEQEHNGEIFLAAKHLDQLYDAKQYPGWSGTLKPERGSLWRHYKGNEYLVVGSAITGGGEVFETYDLNVLYFDARDPLPIPWLRSLCEWISFVDDDKKTTRFTYVDSNDTRDAPSTTIQKWVAVSENGRTGLSRVQ